VREPPPQRGDVLSEALLLLLQLAVGEGFEHGAEGDEEGSDRGGA
jgi:hypothetical protein